MATPKNMRSVNEQEWHTMLGHAIIEEIFVPLGLDTNGNTGDPLHDKLKISRGYPPINAIKNRGRVVGVCIDPSVSLGGFTELFVSPYVHEPMEMAGVLVHELGHAVLGSKVGHGPKFTQFCIDVGLAPPADPMTGKHTPFKCWQLGTVVEPGSPLELKLQSILDTMPPFPGAGLNLSEVEKQRSASKAKTLLLKEYCDNPDCPYFLSEGKVNIARATWSVIRKAGCHTCTKCGTIMVVVLPKVNGKPQTGDDGQPIDPDIPPMLVDGFGEGKPEELPENVRVAGQDTTPNGKPLPGALKPRGGTPKDADDAKNESQKRNEGMGEPEPEPDAMDIDPSEDEMADWTQDDELEDVDDSYGRDAPSTPADNGGSGGRKRSKQLTPKDAHDADPDCDCETCQEAMRLAGMA